MRTRDPHLTARGRAASCQVDHALLGEDLVFASEIKALKQHPQWSFAVDHDAISSFLREGYIRAPRTGIDGVLKQEPGTVLRITAEDVRARRLPAARHYW